MGGGGGQEETTALHQYTQITQQYWYVEVVEGLTQEDDVEVVGVHQPGGGPGHPLADCPLHDGVCAVREGWAVLSDWAVNKSKMLKWVTMCYWSPGRIFDRK